MTLVVACTLGMKATTNDWWLVVPSAPSNSNADTEESTAVVATVVAVAVAAPVRAMVIAAMTIAVIATASTPAATK